jgi:hypothetical protein
MHVGRVEPLKMSDTTAALTSTPAVDDYDTLGCCVPRPGWDAGTADAKVAAVRSF